MPLHLHRALRYFNILFLSTGCLLARSLKFLFSQVCIERFIPVTFITPFLNSIFAIDKAADASSRREKNKRHSLSSQSVSNSSPSSLQSSPAHSPHTPSSLRGSGGSSLARIAQEQLEQEPTRQITLGKCLRQQDFTVSQPTVSKKKKEQSKAVVVICKEFECFVNGWSCIMKEIKTEVSPSGQKNGKEKHRLSESTSL